MDTYVTGALKITGLYEVQLNEVYLLNIICLITEVLSTVTSIKTVLMQLLWN